MRSSQWDWSIAWHKGSFSTAQLSKERSAQQPELCPPAWVALWRLWGMRKIHVFVNQVGNYYSFMQHQSTNHFKIPYNLLQFFLWGPLWGLMTSALWKHKPRSFSKLSGFLSPEELPFPQLSLISGFLVPYQRRKGCEDCEGHLHLCKMWTF